MAFERDKVKSIIFTTNSVIKGYVHIPPGGRLTDFMNNVAKPFIPVTDAEIKFNDGTSISARLLQVSKDYIVALIPEEAISE